MSQRKIVMAVKQGSLRFGGIGGTKPITQAVFVLARLFSAQLRGVYGRLP
jgi:hypothetical protein